MSLREIYKRKNKISFFTTPSHSGKFFIFHKFLNFYKYDISETDTHNPEEALVLSQKEAAKLYGTYKTLYLTNGSSSGIIAAVLSCVKNGENVLMWKDGHISHHNAVRLAKANEFYYEMEYDENLSVFTKADINSFENQLKNNDIKAAIVTSPTYEGFVSDLESIRKLCKKYGCLLIVDEAHGALYPFNSELPDSALKYADIVIQSLHKTAGGLNPTALIHCNNPDIDIESALKLITTTSPSYPLLTSIEANIRFLNSKRGKKCIQNLINNIKVLRNNCQNTEFYGDDITKILIRVKGKDGKYMSGEEISGRLYSKGIEDEKVNKNSVLLLCGVGTDGKKILKLKNVLKHIN